MNFVIRFIPNLFTLGNVAMGILGLVFIAKEEMVLAVYCVVIALILDFFDGFVARLLSVQSKLGGELDSLADMITFGALPGMILFQMISISRGIYFTEIALWSTADYLNCSVALLVPMAAAYRLAVYNLDDTPRPHFLGLPTPAMCITVVSIPLILEAHYHLNFYHLLSDSFIDIIGNERNWEASDFRVVKLMFNPLLYQIASAVLAAMMVIRIPMLSLKLKGFGWRNNKWKYGLVIWAVVAYLIFLLPYLSLPFVEIGLIDFLILPIFMFGYFVLSWIYAIFDAPKSDTDTNEIQS
jgi:CDP-diacylglycerol--serine O-phosphatidyltransferase